MLQVNYKRVFVFVGVGRTVFSTWRLKGISINFGIPKIWKIEKSSNEYRLRK
jgi:hypothetical protein